MLIPLLFSALDLLVNDISDVKSIDTAWKKEQVPQKDHSK